MISDKRRRICEDGEYLVYRADILISSDYYPFGAPMPGRVWEKHVTDTFAVADTLRYYDFEGSTVTTSGIYEYVEEWRNDPGYTNLSVVSVSGNEWLRVTSTSCNHGTIQVFTDMLAGETYTVEYDVDIGTTSGVNLLWWTRVTGGGWTYRGVLQFSNTSGSRSVSFTVPTGADEVLMQFRQGNCGGPTYFMLDNIWIYDLNDQVVTFTPGGYRYGFNGMEKTDEWQGAGMEYTTEFRQYDPRLGRWMSLDPLMDQFPHQSPYVGMDNNPVALNDPDGDCTGPGCGDNPPKEAGTYEGELRAVEVPVNPGDPGSSKYKEYYNYHGGSNNAPSGWYCTEDYEEIISGMAESYWNTGGPRVNGAFSTWAGMDENLTSNRPSPASDIVGNIVNGSIRYRLVGNFAEGATQYDKYDKLDNSYKGTYSSEEVGMGIPQSPALNSADFEAYSLITGVFGAARLGGALMLRASMSLTTADGFLLGGFTIRVPFNIPVQRFGNMNLGKPDFWGVRIGTNQFVNRTFAAIHPNFGNPLTQYTTGVIPKGTTIKFGIIGPQGWKYPGGSLQFIVPSRSVINQSSKLVLR